MHIRTSWGFRMVYGMNTSIRRWMTIDLAAFVALFLVAIFVVGEGLWWVETLGWFELILLGLATYRLANIIATERVTKPLRAPFVDEVRKEGEIVERPKREGFLGATGLILYCASCTGVWVAAFLLYAYFLWPYATTLFALIFALSAIERIVANASNLVRSATE